MLFSAEYLGGYWNLQLLSTPCPSRTAAHGGRSSKLPGIPTWTDAGFRGPVYQDLAECNMLCAPAGAPAAILA